MTMPAGWEKDKHILHTKAWKMKGFRELKQKWDISEIKRRRRSSSSSSKVGKPKQCREVHEVIVCSFMLRCASNFTMLAFTDWPKQGRKLTNACPFIYSTSLPETKVQLDIVRMKCYMMHNAYRVSLKEK